MTIENTSGEIDLLKKLIKSEFDYDDEALEKAKFKLYKKLIQDKTRLSFRQTQQLFE